MSIESRVQKLEEQTGLVGQGEPDRLRTIFVIYVDPGVVDAHGIRTGGGPCDSHRARVCADFCEQEIERRAKETLKDFKQRLEDLPWSGLKNPTRIIYMWVDGPNEPVPREA